MLRHGLRFGFDQKSARKGTRRIAKVGEIDVLPFDVPADAEYGEIRSATIC
jgi:hypothetical protein